MRNILLVGWLMLPIGAWAYHEGPGQDRVMLDECDALMVAAHEAGNAADFKGAVRNYEAALASLPAGNTALSQRLRLELNKARMLASGLPDAREELEVLVDELVADKDSNPQLVAEARQSLARAQFYKTWLMRLEGLTREQWVPEIEAARQNWRLLAEQAKSPEQKAQHEQDLEAAIRLERMEVEDLQGLPLPSE